MNTITAAWLAELVLIAYRSGKQTGAVRPIPHLAIPSEYGGPVIIYGALSLVPEGPWSGPAGLVGWGLVLATFLNLWDPPGSKTNPGTAPKVKQVAPASSAPKTGVVTA